MRWFQLSPLTSWWSGAGRGVLHLEERVATADVDVDSGWLAVRGLLAIVGELELVYEVLVVLLTLLKWWSSESVVVITYSLGPPLRQQDLEGVIIFLSCGGGNYLLDYLLITLITRFLSPSVANFLF